MGWGRAGRGPRGGGSVLAKVTQRACSAQGFGTSDRSRLRPRLLLEMETPGEWRRALTGWGARLIPFRPPHDIGFVSPTSQSEKPGLREGERAAQGLVVAELG